MEESPPEAYFAQQLSQGRFMIQQSRSTGAAVFPPRVMLPGSGVEDLDWIEASGKAIVHSYTLVSQRPPAEPLNICLVDLEEGPRLVTRIVGVDPAQIEIGMPVQAEVEHGDDTAVLVFRPVQS